MWYLGIDEAGYGPTLGPMCSALVAVRLDDAEGAVDLWSRLGGSVCRDLKAWRAGGGRSIPVADSKALKLANSSKTRDPLFHLERGVLAFALATGVELARDADVFEHLGVGLGDDPWFEGDGASLPLACDGAELRLASNALRGALERAGVSDVRMRCEAIEPRAFNELVGRTGTKASAAAQGIAKLLEWARQSLDLDRGPVRLVCDRLGGRTRYSGVLARVFDGHGVRVVTEDDEQSVYAIERAHLEPTASDTSFRVMFRSEAERAHLPVALSSMVAKWTRELAMARFNRYWSSRATASGLELKPTAGYALDARRWLADCSGLLNDAERSALVRRS